jgi:hypothetical protein
VCDSTRTELLLQYLEECIGEYLEKHKRDFLEVQKLPKLRTVVTQVGKAEDVNHIDYIIPDDNPIKKREYSQFIAKECMLRKINTVGSSVEEWHEILRDCVKLERKLQFLITLRQWHQEGIDKVPLVLIIELLIPCILHLENRVGEKIISMIIWLGLEKCNQPTISFISKLQDVFRTEVLGSHEAPSQWKMSYKKNADGSIQLDPIQEHNQVVRCMIQHIEHIINGALPEMERELKAKLILACSKYSEAITILTAHRALTEDEMEQFQDLIDDFFETWVELFGNDGMTNYLHLLGSGHVLYFLQKYKCLYIYSQQGWEALNSICTGYILQNSSRGGYGSGQNKTKSYIFPLILYIMRDLLWKTNMADAFFMNKE